MILNGMENVHSQIMEKREKKKNIVRFKIPTERGGFYE